MAANSELIQEFREALEAEIEAAKQDATARAVPLVDGRRIGKVVLGTFIEIDARSISRSVSARNISFDEAEREILGIDHAEAGAVLLESWGLPADVVEIVRYHHRPDEFDGDRLGVDLVHIADILSMESGIGAGEMDGLCYRISPGAKARRKLRALEKETVLYNMLCALEEMRAAMTPSLSQG